MSSECNSSRSLNGVENLGVSVAGLPDVHVRTEGHGGGNAVQYRM